LITFPFSAIMRTEGRRVAKLRVDRAALGFRIAD
jgi:hypothetical protein